MTSDTLPSQLAGDYRNAQFRPGYTPPDRLRPKPPRTEAQTALGAGLIARRWGFGRRELDEFSVLGHERGAAAVDAGAFGAQVVAVPTEAGPFTVDQGLRRGTTADTWARSSRSPARTACTTPAARRRSPTAPPRC